MFGSKHYFLIPFFITIVLIPFLDILHIFYIILYILSGSTIITATIAVGDSIAFFKIFFGRKTGRREMIVVIVLSIESILTWLIVSGLSLIGALSKFDNVSLFLYSQPVLGVLATAAAATFLSLSICIIWVTLDLKLRSR